MVEDARLDARFAHSPLVTGKPHIRFYAGAPILTRDGFALGSFCIISHAPRSLAPDQRIVLARLAGVAAAALELREAFLASGTQAPALP